ncbi:Josephin-like protein [Blattella germanica]|nr:Josephin-like protein [Blattella germanica]
MQTTRCWKNTICLENCWSRGDNRIGVAMNGAIYHERQVKELCALHALNNLFQERDAFSKAELDEICYSLSPNVWINPHKSLLGLGNYDINVIMAALQRKGYEAIWFDKRKDPKCLNLDNIYGFILNVPSDYKLGFVLLPLRRRHWVAILEQNQSWQHDSKIESTRNHVHLEAANQALIPDTVVCNNRTMNSPLLELNR